MDHSLQDITPPLPWKTLTSREIYRTNRLRVREDIAKMPNGKQTLYSVCEMGQAVGVLPFVDATHVIMVRQYRYVWQESQRWEIPTGGVHPDEPLADAAQRELIEETGYRAGKLIYLNSHYTSKSICHETAHLYVGRDLQPASALPDDTEDLQVAVMPFREVLDLVMSSEIRDAMSVIAILWAASTASGTL